MTPGMFSKKKGLYKLNDMLRQFGGGGKPGDDKKKGDIPTTFKNLGVSDSSAYAGTRPFLRDASRVTPGSVNPPGFKGTGNWLSEVIGGGGSNQTEDHQHKFAIGQTQYNDLLHNVSVSPALEKMDVSPYNLSDGVIGTDYDQFNNNGRNTYSPGNNVVVVRKDSSVPSVSQKSTYGIPAGMVDSDENLVQGLQPAFKTPFSGTRVVAGIKRQGGSMDTGEFGSDSMNFMFKKGGSIHIKPSHKGRFTAFKKRTGESTAQAMHSSNPHVRQMANFAHNAAGWKHADGGMIGGIGKAPHNLFRADIAFNDPTFNTNYGAIQNDQRGDAFRDVMQAYYQPFRKKTKFSA